VLYYCCVSLSTAQAIEGTRVFARAIGEQGQPQGFQVGNVSSSILASL
jgi:hypothetical protein